MRSTVSVYPSDDAVPVLRAEGVIVRVIASRFRFGRIGGLRLEERDDLRAVAMLRVLEQLRAEQGPAAIEDFDGYVATVAKHACDDLLRERMPRRTSAKNRIRYVVGHDPRFAQWSTGGEVVCGFDEWRGLQHFASRVAIDRIAHTPGDRDVARTLTAILDAAGEPVEIDAIVDCAAVLWDMIDRPAAPLEEHEPAAPHREPVRDLENRQFLEQAWNEIRQLNRPQRVALLLNLRDDSGPAVELFPLLGVASIREIAETLELTASELAPLWRDLPLGDLRIAAILGVTRQQVINLRKSARERLVRRMRYCGTS